MKRCDVCDHPLSHRGRQVTGLCISCRRDGARFSYAWMHDLRASGLRSPAIAEIVGVPPMSVNSRLSEIDRGLVTP